MALKYKKNSTVYTVAHLEDEDQIFKGNIQINGNLTVLGSGTEVELETLDVHNHEIIVNAGLEPTSSPINDPSGIKVNRGVEDDYEFKFFENAPTGDTEDESFRIGVLGNYQSVATRQDTDLLANGDILKWNNTANRLDKSSINDDGDKVSITGDLVVKNHDFFDMIFYLW